MLVWHVVGRMPGTPDMLRRLLRVGRKLLVNRVRVVLLVALPALVVSAARCGQTDGDGSPASPEASAGTTADAGDTGAGGAGGATSDSGDSSWRIDVGDALAGYDGPKYDGDTSCTPDGSPFEQRSCCEGVPCHGECRFIGGTWQCSCFGIVGAADRSGSSAALRVPVAL